MGERDAVDEVERDRPEEADFLAGGLRGRGHEKAERPGNRKNGADNELRDFVWLAPTLPVPAIKDRDEREEGNADDGVERYEPGGRQFFAHENEVELLVAPDKIGVKDLVIRDDRDGKHGNEKDEAKRREQKRSLEGHQEMAGRHGECAEKHGAAPA